MKLRAMWAWTISGLIVVGSQAQAKPPGVPTHPTTDGKAPTTAEQEHFETPPSAKPNSLPGALLEGLYRKYPLPIAGTLAGGLMKLESDVIPVSGMVGSLQQRPTTQAQEAFEMGETLFKSCKGQESRSWFQRVVFLAPKTEIAKQAEARLIQTSRFGNVETAEPPFADKTPADVAALQLQVLRIAAQQYRDAVKNGQPNVIIEAGKLLDDVLKQTK